MKKAITVLLLIALSFSMLACAAPAPVEAAPAPAEAAPAPAEAVPTAEPVPSKGDLLYEKYSEEELHRMSKGHDKKLGRFAQ